MKSLLKAGSFSLLLLATASASAAPADDPLGDLLQQFGQSLEQGSEISLPYLKSYLQCFDDQRQLQSDQSLDLEALLQQGLAASESCAPLIQQMVEALQQQRSDDEAARNLQQLIEKSL